MQKRWFGPFGLLAMGLLLQGCLTSGQKAMDVISPSTLRDARIIVVQLPEKPPTVSKELWSRSMADFGLESAMIETLMDKTEAQVLTGRVVNAAISAENKARMERVKEFSDAVSSAPKASRRLSAVIEENLPKLAPLVEADYVMAGWISTFSVMGTTKTYIGPANSQSRDCRIIANIALYDIKAKTLLRNVAKVEYSVSSMGLMVTPTAVITDFDLSAANSASQDALQQAVKNLFNRTI